MSSFTPASQYVPADPQEHSYGGKYPVKTPPNEIQEEKKPRKPARQQRITKFLQRAEKDNLEWLNEDLIEENKRLVKELETVRNVNAAIQKELSDFRMQLFSDRIANLND